MFSIMKKRRILLSWLLSYTLILLLPLASSIISYYAIQRTVRDQILKTNDIVLTQAQTILDTLVLDMKRLGYQFTFNREVISLVSTKGKFSAEQQFDVQTLSKLLAQHKASNSYIDDIYIYFEGVDRVVTSVTQASPKELCQINNIYSADEYEDFTKFLSEKYSDEFFLAKGFNTQDETLVFATTLGNSSTGANFVNMVIPLNVEQYMNILNNIKWSEESRILLLSPDNSILFATNEMTDYMTDAVEIFKQNKEQSSATIDTSDSIISYVNSQNSKITYLSVTPKNVFWFRINMIRNIALVSCILSILLGELLLVLIIRKNYSPINKLLNKIKKNFAELRRVNDEYQFIHDIFEQTLNQNKELTLTLDRQKNVMLDNIILKLLNGKLNSYYNVHEILMKHSEKSLDKKYFTVMLVYIQDYSKLFEGAGNISEYKKLDIVRFSINNVFSDLIGDFISTDADDRLHAFILNTDKNNIFDELRESISKAQIFLSDNFGILFSTAVSNTHETVEAVNIAYQEALSAIEKIDYSGQEKIIFYRDIIFDSCNYYYTAEIEFCLVNFIKDGDYENSLTVIKEIFNEGDIFFNRCLKYDVLGTIMKLIPSRDVENLIDNIKNNVSFDNANTISEIQTEFEGILLNLCNYFKNKKELSSNNKLISNIKDYVMANYSKQDLTVNSIGNYFNMTSNYLSKLFKEETEMGLHNYISYERVEASKELLTTTALNINEIARMVGFVDSKTMIRVFKKYTGLTPGKYKEIHSD